jgi:hypothetical protein
MVNAIEYPQVESMMHFDQGQIEVLKLSIPNNCYVVGRTIAEIAQDSRFPTGSLIIGYQPHPHGKLKPCPTNDTSTLPKTKAMRYSRPGSVVGKLNARAIESEPLMLPKKSKCCQRSGIGRSSNESLLAADRP